MKYLLTLSFLLILTGCSTKPIKTTTEVAVLPPEALLVSPCDNTKAGDTLESLSSAYIDQSGCIKKYKTTLQTLREWRETKSKLYPTNGLENKK
jgi:hypothetical protein